MKRLKKVYICLFTIFLSVQSLTTDEFFAGTSVKTPTGFLSIEQLQLNDEVLCFDLLNAYKAHPIIHITTGATDHYVQLCIWYTP